MSTSSRRHSRAWSLKIPPTGAGHHAQPAERNVTYERVIRETTRIDDLRAHVDGAVPREA